MLATAARSVAAALLTALLVPTVPAHAQAPAGPAYVTRVVSGDTLFAELGGRLEVVRYLGINAPRIEHPTRGPGPYADAAREANRRLVEGKWIYLVFEGPPRDRGGRLLAYVWSGDLFVNAALVHHGYGEASATTAGAHYGEYLRTLESGARQEGRGLWRDREALAYHRPRPAEDEPGAGDSQERAADAAGGRVFSAPAPFLPSVTPGSPAPNVGAPAAPRASPSYIPPRGSTRTR
jgi:micrococcal nuclease